ASAVVLTGGGDETGILATVVGGAPGADPGARPSAAGMREAVDACLARAGLTREQVDLVIGEQATDPLIDLFDAVGEGRVRPGTEGGPPHEPLRPDGHGRHPRGAG